jgi:hypothetical protein
VEQTKGHLDLLGIFHYVGAGLTLVCGGGYGLMMAGMAAAIGTTAQKGGNPPPPELTLIFGGMGVLFAGIMGAFAIVIALAGWCLRARKAWLYCVVIAAISLTYAPIGTALGVFSLIVLLRPEAKALFAAGGAPPPAPPA